MIIYFNLGQLNITWVSGACIEKNVISLYSSKTRRMYMVHVDAVAHNCCADYYALMAVTTVL